ncbi:PEP-CTERM sorting domain-containing protein [Iodidimonas sp. SYSU 1G8]|uniref:PEP-CTERM sorting domain-containing protein n=1 Tax=Iodidimonas sp. SYSU 1G8 TaxID=3133967 RepID=UPI0031FEF67A
MSAKACILSAVAALGLFAFGGGNAEATYDAGSIPGLQYTGLSFSPPFGSSHRNNVEAAIESTLAPGIDVSFVGRLDGIATQSATGSDPVFDDSLSATCTNGSPSDCKAGTWTFDAGSSDFLIAFIEISGGGASKLYEVIDYSLVGLWNTYDLFNGGGGNPGLSHLDFYGTVVSSQSGGGGVPVPEPAALGLLAVGAFSLAFLRQRRKTAR